MVHNSEWFLKTGMPKDGFNVLHHYSQWFQWYPRTRYNLRTLIYRYKIYKAFIIINSRHAASVWSQCICWLL